MGDAVIELVEREACGDGSFAVRVVYPGEGVEYDVTVTDPASVADEELLAWYFERHLRYPFLDGDRRAAAVKLLRGYGIALFGQVFGGAAGRGYERLRGKGFDGCRIEVVAGAGLHRLHWEALFDPELDAPLALRVPVTRRVQLQPARFEIAAAQPTLNILLVTARPRGASDVGYRTISRPLVEAVRQASLPVQVDVVRPGTWAGLRAHLEAARDRHKSGWYQLVHFDVHGAFADHAALTAGSRAGRYLFAPGENPEFVGKQGFLFFETAEVGKADPRSAVEVANLLAEYRVPIAVLNACQSAMQTDNEVALAQQLVQAGVPVVVGMAYSVTVTAAELAMPVLYEHLARGVDTEAALRVMRRCLFDTPERRVYFDQTLPLSDWVLPVVFRQRSVSLELRAMTPPEIDKFEARQAQVGDEPRVTYGQFVGRDLDVQAIEQMLLVDTRRNQILVRGMAGAGKSTLLAHLGWWWQRTGLIEETFTFNYLERAWTVDQIVRTIADRVWPDKLEFATWDSLSETAKRERVARVLRSQRHLLIIDNTESITATPAAIPHALPEADREALQTWMSRLRGGKSLIVWGSREAESWVAAHSFDTNVYELGGLDPQAASILADRILTHHHATATLHDPSQRDSLDHLLTLLDGYPLPLEVVLPNLATTAPATVLAELKAGGATADPVGLIGAAIGYSHSKLDPTLQHSLALLAPFTAVIPGGDILTEYQRLLYEVEPTEDRWGSLDLASGVAAAVEIGLATAHDTLRGWVQTVPILPYFLRRILHEHPLWWQAAVRAHYQLHARLGPQLKAMLTSNDPDQRSAGRAATHAAYANLRTAIDTALDHGQPALPVLEPVEELLDQTHQHTARQQLLFHAITTIETRTDPASRRELPTLLHLAGMVAQAQRRYEQAEDYYQQALDLKLEFGNRHSAASTYHQLGIVAQDQRRYEQAEDYYRQALDLKLEFGNRHSAASTYHQLGRVAEEQRRYEQAKDYYRQALDLELEFGDRHSAALTYHQLGRVAEEQRRYEQAKDYYQQALDLKREFGDRHGAASTYHQLGIVAQEQRRYEQAKDYYRQALDLKLEFGDRHGAALTYHQLGIVAQEQRRYEQAEDYYQQALDLKLELGNHYSAASTYHQLGTVAQEQRRYEQAEDYYRQSLDLKLELGNRHGAALTYHQLGTVAQEQRRYEQAKDYYQQALDLKLELGNRHGAALTYHQLGRVAEEQRRYEQAEDYYRQALQAFLDSRDELRASQVAAVLGRCLTEAGHRDEAFIVLVEAAINWRELTGNFDTEALRLLAELRAQLDEDTVRAVLHGAEPAVAAELTRQLDRLHGP